VRRRKAAPKLKTFAEVRRGEDAEHMLNTARLFDASGRRVPGHILRRLWGLRSEWKGKGTVPSQVTEGCAILDRIESRQD
jgi:hypothetical protein